MQCAAGEIRREEPGDAGLALKTENFTNGCAAAERTLSAAARLLGLVLFHRGFFLAAPAFLPLSVRCSAFWYVAINPNA